MIIKCVRCGAKIETPNKDNAKYIVNPEDKRTWGKDIKEKIIRAPLSQNRIQEILKIKTTPEHPFTMADFLKSKEIFPDEYGRREIVIEEEVETPKTAIVCPNCLNEKDAVIW